MTLNNSSMRTALLRMLIPALALTCWSPAQTSAPLRVATPQKESVRAGQDLTVKLYLMLGNGYHVNSDTPSDPYLIPLRLTWESAPLEVASVVYPKGEMHSYAFSDKPLSVYTGDFELETRFKVPAKAPKGERKITGKVRYQACNQSMCLSPRTIPVELQLVIR